MFHIQALKVIRRIPLSWNQFYSRYSLPGVIFCHFAGTYSKPELYISRLSQKLFVLYPQISVLLPLGSQIFSYLRHYHPDSLPPLRILFASQSNPPTQPANTWLVQVNKLINSHQEIGNWQWIIISMADKGSWVSFFLSNNGFTLFLSRDVVDSILTEKELIDAPLPLSNLTPVNTFSTLEDSSKVI